MHFTSTRGYIIKTIAVLPDVQHPVFNNCTVVELPFSLQFKILLSSHEKNKHHSINKNLYIYKYNLTLTDKSSNSSINETNPYDFLGQSWLYDYHTINF